MGLVIPRALLSLRRGVAAGLAVFGAASVAGAVSVAAGKLWGVETLFTIGLWLPISAAAGVIAGVVRVMYLPRARIAAWLDLHTGARGALAALAEISPQEPFYTLVREQAQEAMRRSGMGYLKPFFPVWAPIILAAGAIWGMALLIPEFASPTAVTVEYAAMLPGGRIFGGGPTEQVKPEWTAMVVAPMPQTAGAGADAEKQLPNIKGQVQKRNGIENISSGDDGAGGNRTSQTGEASGGISGEGSGAGDTGVGAVDASRGRAGMAELPLPERWQTVVNRYRDLLLEENNRR